VKLYVRIPELGKNSPQHSFSGFSGGIGKEVKVMDGPLLDKVNATTLIIAGYN
jgi:hypothetical protein